MAVTTVTFRRFWSGCYALLPNWSKWHSIWTSRIEICVRHWPFWSLEWSKNEAFVLYHFQLKTVFTPATWVFPPNPFEPGKVRSYPSFTCSPDLKDKTVHFTIFQAIAISSTLYCLLKRNHIQRLWWDDSFVVVLPLVCILWRFVCSFEILVSQWWVIVCRGGSYQLWMMSR